jgi:hypothetical protein
MRWRRGQGERWVTEPTVGVGEMDPTEEVGGWSMSTGAAANHTAAVRWVLWALIVSGPVLGGLGFLAATSTAGAAAPAAVHHAAPERAEDGTGPAGFAELFVSAYLSAGQGDQDALAAFWPGAKQAQFEGTSGARQVTQTAAVRTVALTGGLWSVTVAAQVIEPDAQPADSTGGASSHSSASGGASGPAAGSGGSGLRYFQVAVASTGGSGAGPWAYSVVSAPAEVSAPAAAPTPTLTYGSLQPAGADDARVQTVAQFLTAYLTGTGDGSLDRYLSPGTTMQPVSPAPYAQVEVDEIAAAGPGANDPAAAGRVPGDGTRQQVMVTVRATGRDGTQVPLSYAMTLTARAGRWEISSLAPAPVLARPGTAPASAASPLGGPASASSVPAPSTTAP